VDKKVQKMRMNKKATLQWEYIAAVVLVLLIVVVMLLMSQSIKNIIWEKGKEAIVDLLKKVGRP